MSIHKKTAVILLFAIFMLLIVYVLSLCLLLCYTRKKCAITSIRRGNIG